MTAQERYGATAVFTTIATLAAMWMCRDTIISSLKKRLTINAKERLRVWTLKMRGQEDYVGRHRAVLA